MSFALPDDSLVPAPRPEIERAKQLRTYGKLDRSAQYPVEEWKGQNKFLARQRELILWVKILIALLHLVAAVYALR